MKKRYIAFSGIAMAALLAFTACESTDRYDRHGDAGAIGNTPANGAGSIGNLPGNGGVVSDKPTVGDIDKGVITTPDENSTVKAAGNVYQIHISPENGSITSNQAQKIHYDIKDLFSDKEADSGAIEKIEFVVDGKLAKFINYKGEEGNTFTLEGSSATAVGDVAIKSLNHSGQMDVTFRVTISGITNTLTKRFPVVVIKNSSSSISMIPVPNYAAYDKYKNGLYVDKYTLHVVDKYGNKAKDGTYVHVGTVNNLKQDAGLRLYSKQFPIPITGGFTSSTNSFTFDDERTLENVNSDNEQSVDTQDTIVILPNEQRSDPRYLGGWRIGDIQNDKLLTMVDTYTWEDKKGLSFVIGDDKKFNNCDATLANAAIYSDTDYKVKDGIVNIELRYGPYMVGKSVFLYANSLIDGDRIGISRKIDLKGTGIEDMTYSCDASDMNTSRSCSWTGYLKFSDSGVDVKNVNVGRRVTDYDVLNSDNKFIGCDSAAHETITAPAGKKVSVTVKYVIENELP